MTELDTQQMHDDYEAQNKPKIQVATIQLQGVENKFQIMIKPDSQEFQTRETQENLLTQPEQLQNFQQSGRDLRADTMPTTNQEELKEMFIASLNK